MKRELAKIPHQYKKGTLLDHNKKRGDIRIRAVQGMYTEHFELLTNGDY